MAESNKKTPTSIRFPDDLEAKILKYVEDGNAPTLSEAVKQFCSRAFDQQHETEAELRSLRGRVINLQEEVEKLRSEIPAAVKSELRAYFMALLGEVLENVTEPREGESMEAHGRRLVEVTERLFPDGPKSKSP